MRLYFEPSLFFQGLGIRVFRFQDFADLRIAPSGQFRRSGYNINEIVFLMEQKLVEVNGSDFR